jgi:hypothetical protein
MKQTSIVIILQMTLICTMAQKNGESKIVFDKTLYDFGIIDKGSKAECTFSFMNKSQTPVAIVNVKASCGCTASTWLKEPVKPDGSGEIKVKYNTNNIGFFDKTVTVYTSGNENIILTIRGEVKKKKKSR